MNRIRKLAEEATEYCLSNYKDISQVPWVWEEKFAELIVKKCAEQCNWNSEAERVCEYFGVIR